MSSPNPSALQGLLSYLTPPEREQLDSLLSMSHPSLATWLSEASPALRWDWPYLVHIREQLDRVTRGEIARLMLFVPPRHGKSTLTTIHYPAYRLECDGRTRVAIAAYNADLAQTFSRAVRALVRRRGRVALNEERQAAGDWRTVLGGGLRAVGVGGGLTGHGADLVIVDDPFKSREDADSPIERDRVWDWYTSDVYTRLEPGGAIVLICTRWHTDDLAGRILASARGGDWIVISLPALAEAGDPLGRAVGAPLCPDRYDAAALDDFRAVLGSRSFDALYQQRPRPQEGALFKRQWFPIVPALPAGCAFVRYWDTAGADVGKGDATAGVLLARDRHGYYFVVDVQCGQWTAHPRNTIIQQTAALDRQRYGSVPTYIESPPGLAKESTDAIVRLLAGYPVYADRVSSDKINRASPVAAQAEAGNVALIAGAWNAQFLDELTDFPFGAHDDQVDGLSGAFNRLAGSVATQIHKPAPVANRWAELGRPGGFSRGNEF